ncbi:Myocilin Myocilin 55 kDa subunit Trabecular meshwork-induced glucocorticoid response protein [Larimichthys crocea]|uniref:Myocilin n=1 Tax=Larimichthys crocea TaxID=215358 RepID=A0A6G0IIA7_LARCR|nr:Myocilin Myocilin 55 kDa subunit Trabecular meshwork-induced glucocorticoid response protein [Larimichthys crocea]
MWLQVLYLCLSCLTLCQSQAQLRASLNRSNDQAGRCHYTFTVASPVESSCSGSSMKPEMDGVLSRLTLLEALVSRLIVGVDGDVGTRAGANGEEGLQKAYSQVTGERNQLQQDKEHLNKQVQELQRRLDELSEEAESLRQKPCQQTHTSQHENRPASDPAYDSGNASYQEMKAEVTEVPASQLIPEVNHNFTGCGELQSVGDPVLHRKADSITGKYGVWLQDPEPLGTLYTNKTVWRIDTVGKDVRQLFAYDDMEQFSKGFPMKVLVLPESVESTGAAVYRGSLYYQRRRSRTLIRYDLASETLASRLDLPHAGFHGQHPYSWGGYTDIDLAVDEQGLWAIYSTSKAKGAIVISQLDPESLEVKKSWETNIRKNTVANAFMVCGRLYTVASYTAPNTTINFVYDTATNAGRAVAVPFKNKYRYNSMVDYNHAQRKLYAWDNFHMVTYDVRLGRASHGSS